MGVLIFRAMLEPLQSAGHFPRITGESNFRTDDIFCWRANQITLLSIIPSRAEPK